MRKYLIFLVVFSFFGVINAQNKIIVAKYSLHPYSDEYLSVGSENISEEDKKFNLAMRKTLEFQYTMLVDEAKKNAVFYLDTLVTRKIKGKEDYWTEAENKMSYAFRKGDKFCSNQEIFDAKIYSVADKSFDYGWQIKKETKKINGVYCQKAESNIRGNKIIAWFTKDIPISYGPLNYWGLPGLIVQVEDFFNTITLTGLEYSNDTTLLDKKLTEYENKFEKEKEDNQVSLSVFLLKKSNLIKRLKNMVD